MNLIIFFPSNIKKIDTNKFINVAGVDTMKKKDCIFYVNRNITLFPISTIYIVHDA